MNNDLVSFVAQYPWESETQKEGFLNLVQFLRKRQLAYVEGRENILVPLPVPAHLLAIYFIEKDRESIEWIKQYINTVTGQLENRIKVLEEKLNGLDRTIDMR